MRRLAALSLLLPAFALAACGGEDTTSIPEIPTGATGVGGAVDSSSMTVEEYLGLSTADQLAAVEDAVETNPDCEGVDTSPGGDLQVAAAIDATVAVPETPLAERCRGRLREGRLNDGVGLDGLERLKPRDQGPHPLGLGRELILRLRCVAQNARAVVAGDGVREVQPDREDRLQDLVAKLVGNFRGRSHREAP